MSRHLLRDMERIHREVLSLSCVVEEMIDRATLALCERSDSLAAVVIQSDAEVDRLEVSIEEDCLKMLALHQPVAVDLRRIATVLKVNNDLERIADLAVNTAERAKSINRYPQFPIPHDVRVMANMATRMVRGALDAFVNLDTQQARSVLRTDSDLDSLNVHVIDQLTEIMQQTAALVPPALHCFSASRHIERIGDHATNIAEDVIYLVEGDIVRHQYLSDSRTARDYGQSEDTDY
jgi:phosphate transport system protein